MAESISSFRSLRLAMVLITVIAFGFLLSGQIDGRSAMALAPRPKALPHSTAAVNWLAPPTDPDEITSVYAKIHGHKTPAVHVYRTHVVCRIEVKGKTNTDRLAKLRIRDLSNLKVVDTLYGLIRKNKDAVEIGLDSTYALNHLSATGDTVSYSLEAIVGTKQNNGNLYVEPVGTRGGPEYLLLQVDGLSIYIAKDAPTSCGPEPTSTFTPNQPGAYASVVLNGNATVDDSVTVDFYDATDPDNWSPITPNTPTAFTIAMGTTTNRGLIDNTGNTAANGPLYLPSTMSYRIIKMVASVKIGGTTLVGRSEGTYTIQP